MVPYYPLTDDKGSRTLYEEMHVPHFLQMSARGIFGRGRDIRRDSTGTAGSLRRAGSSVLEERISLQSVAIIVQVVAQRSGRGHPDFQVNLKVIVVFTKSCYLIQPTMPHYSTE